MHAPPELNNSERGLAVYDPFLGSGTTLIAAETTGRVCFAIELDPLYVDVSVRRWQAFTGKGATLLADGVTFDVVAAPPENADGDNGDEAMRGIIPSAGVLVVHTASFGQLRW
jgi:hypothetical protein